MISRCCQGSACSKDNRHAVTKPGHVKVFCAVPKSGTELTGSNFRFKCINVPASADKKQILSEFGLTQFEEERDRSGDIEWTYSWTFCSLVITKDNQKDLSPASSAGILPTVHDAEKEEAKFDRRAFLFFETLPSEGGAPYAIIWPYWEKIPGPMKSVRTPFPDAPPEDAESNTNLGAMIKLYQELTAKEGVEPGQQGESDRSWRPSTLNPTTELELSTVNLTIPEILGGDSEEVTEGQFDDVMKADPPPTSGSEISADNVQAQLDSLASFGVIGTLSAGFALGNVYEIESSDGVIHTVVLITSSTVVCLNMVAVTMISMIYYIAARIKATNPKIASSFLKRVGVIRHWSYRTTVVTVPLFIVSAVMLALDKSKGFLSTTIIISTVGGLSIVALVYAVCQVQESLKEELRYGGKIFI